MRRFTASALRQGSRQSGKVHPPAKVGIGGCSKTGVCGLGSSIVPAHTALLRQSYRLFRHRPIKSWRALCEPVDCPQCKEHRHESSQAPHCVVHRNGFGRSVSAGSRRRLLRADCTTAAAGRGGPRRSERLCVGAWILGLERSSLSLGEGTSCSCPTPRALGSSSLGRGPWPLAHGARSLGSLSGLAFEDRTARDRPTPFLYHPAAARVSLLCAPSRLP